MRVYVRWNDQQQARFAGLLERMEARGDNLRPALDDIAEDFRALSDEAFRTRGASLGARWRPLDPAYLAQRRRQGRGTTILELQGSPPSGRGGDPGRLRRSLTRKGDRWHVERVGFDGLLIGTKVGIAAAHQRGATVTVPARTVVVRSGPRKGAQVRRPGRTVRIPVRRFVKVTAQTRGRWLDMIADHVTGADDAPTFGGLL